MGLTGSQGCQLVTLYLPICPIHIPQTRRHSLQLLPASYLDAYGSLQRLIRVHLRRNPPYDASREVKAHKNDYTSQ